MWRVAIIGCGNIAGGYDENSAGHVCQTHARACQLLPEVELVAVCDSDPEKAKLFAQRWGASSFHVNAREMLAQTRLDIVAICSPTETHIDMLSLCLERSEIHAVLCEKPVGFDPVRLATLLPKFEIAGVLLAVNYMRAYALGIQSRRPRLAELGGCVEARIDYGKGVFSYGSHALQWLTDWLGEISRIEVTNARPGPSAADPNVDATFLAGETPVQWRGGDEVRFDIEFRCVRGALRFSQNACEGTDGVEVFSTDLETVLLDVYQNLIARLEGRAARLVEGAEALATLDACAKLAALSHDF